MAEIAALWRRIDTPGHDACRVVDGPSGHRLEGVAVFRQDGVPGVLRYGVTADDDWQSRQGFVRGWIGDRAVDYLVVRGDAGVWRLNGTRVSGLDDCVDLDLGFTPATNLLCLRRMGLTIGQSAEAESAWLDVTGGTLEGLSQRYERRAPELYWYEAPRFDYAALLEVAPSGLVRHYPGLWEMESS